MIFVWNINYNSNENEMNKVEISSVFPLAGMFIWNIWYIEVYYQILTTNFEDSKEKCREKFVEKSCR